VKTTNDRRQFLKSAAISTAGLLAARSFPAWARPAAVAPAAAVTPPVSVFAYPKVQLLEGPFRLQF
jgi:hypothetical protein